MVQTPERVTFAGRQTSEQRDARALRGGLAATVVIAALGGAAALIAAGAADKHAALVAAGVVLGLAAVVAGFGFVGRPRARRRSVRATRSRDRPSPGLDGRPGGGSDVRIAPSRRLRGVSIVSHAPAWADRRRQGVSRP
jgi:hypothetical protein